MNNRQIILKKIKVNNLKKVDLTFNPNQLIIVTGVSGSGKSSLVFDTIYMEGQRRYIDTLDDEKKHFFKNIKKPDFQEISGLSPTIAIEQKSLYKNNRSTVGTITKIYDFLEILFARKATAHCPISNEIVKPQNKELIIEEIKKTKKQKKIYFLANIIKNKRGDFSKEFKELLKKGFLRIRVDGEIYDLTEIKKLNPKKIHSIDIVVDRLTISNENSLRIEEAIYNSLDIGNGFFTILDIQKKEEKIFSEYGYCKKSNRTYLPLTPQDFSFNHPKGMCEKCLGLKEIYEFDLKKIINPYLSIKEDCCVIAPSYKNIRYKNIYDNLSKIYNFDISTPFENLPKLAKKAFLHGTKTCNWKGVLYEANKRSNSIKIEDYRKKITCPICNGHRLKKYPLSATFKNKKIYEITNMTIEEVYYFFKKIQFEKSDFEKSDFGNELISEISKRLKFLKDIGLGYLTLDRSTSSLSEGELQRVKISSHLSSSLNGCIYILDEPSTGLHPKDNKKLIKMLENLKNKGNTVIVVEHDRETICSSDHIIDLGLKGGKEGGNIIFQGSIKDIKKNKDSITGKYLSNKYSIEIPKKKKFFHNFISIFGASHNNLKDIDVKIPLNSFVCITGVSGSGKSSLISQTLYPALSNLLDKKNRQMGKYKRIEGVENIKKIVLIDHTKNYKSDIASYLKIFDKIIKLFNQDNINFKKAFCSYCKGSGKINIEDGWITCPKCKGKKFKEEILSITYKDYNIFDILQMDIKKALILFDSIPYIKQRLELLIKVGLDYLPLGQYFNTLSSGEIERIKLAKELSKKRGKQILYILEEPTKGLHFHDIHKLVKVIKELINKGNSFIVIEHNTDLIKTSDYIIELGPKAGEKGGEIIASSPYEEFIKKKTATAFSLKTSFIKKVKTKKNVKKVKYIIIKEANTNNLKNISIKIPLNKISIFTGPSGSGKTSLAVDTLYATGEKRYLATTPFCFQQFIKQKKIKVKKIENLPPCILLKNTLSINPKKTLGTILGIYNSLKILYTHMGIPYCNKTDEKLKKIDKHYIFDKLLKEYNKKKVYILSLLKKENFQKLQKKLIQKGFLRIRLNKKYYELEEKIPFNKNLKNQVLLVIDRLEINKFSKKRILESLDLAFKKSNEIILEIDKKDLYFASGKNEILITPNTFSFNSEEGICLNCQGLGYVYTMDLKKNYSIKDFFKDNKYLKLTKKYFSYFDVDITKPIKTLSKKDKKIFFEKFKYHLISFMDKKICPSCNGQKLNPLACNVKIKNFSLPTLCSLEINESYKFLSNLKTKEKFLKEIIFKIKTLLKFLIEIGLGYLSLNREISTLSSGEIQRTLLTKYLALKLTNCLYILDNPSSGLHPNDTPLLIKALKKIKNLKNTIIVIENNPIILKIADKIFNFGPKAGFFGGRIISSKMPKNKNLTKKHLSKKIFDFIYIKNGFFHNLKNININIPKGVITTIVGVSGSGKSTLINFLKEAVLESIKTKLETVTLPYGKVLNLNFKKIISDQKLLNYSIHSDVSSYLEIIPLIRSFFSAIYLSKTKGFTANHFNNNHNKGMCKECNGLGYKKIDLKFLPEETILCENCKGYKLNKRSLEIKYKQKHIGHILEMTVEEAINFFSAFPKIVKKLKKISYLGLEYLQLGQKLNTLSTGEIQRIKLAKEFLKKTLKKSLFIFDEPTIGLNQYDIEKLFKIFQSLKNKGHTIILIEHNLDIISLSDYIIELGPKGGKEGGKVVFTGSLKKILKNKHSLTGKYLQKKKLQ